MKRLKSFLTLLLLPAITAAADAPVSTVTPGQYIRSRDSGTLTVRKDASSGLRFEIESMGGNCHTCSISGTIRQSVGKGDPWAADNSDSKCVVSFDKSASGVAVSTRTNEECRAYCGARASFEGSYKAPPRSCTQAAQKGTRDRFLSLYRARQFSQASDTLGTLLSQCDDFIDWITVDRMRNDLALAQLHSGHPAQCLKSLETTVAWKYGDEKSLKENLPPCDFDNYLAVAKSTWHNKALCEKPANRR